MYYFKQIIGNYPIIILKYGKYKVAVKQAFMPLFLGFLPPIDDI
jgi:hypothetical protein